MTWTIGTFEVLIIYILRSDSSGVCSDFIEGHSVLGCNLVTYDKDFVVHKECMVTFYMY